MSLRDDIFNLITNNLIGVNCDNCINKKICPEIQYKPIKESEGACVDWAVSDDLAEEFTDNIMDLIYKKLGVR